MARKDLAYASVWIRKKYLGNMSANDQSVMLMYANPGFRIRERVLADDHSILTRLKKQDAFSVQSMDDNFSNYITEKRIESGAFAIFALGELGFLKLYSMRRKEGFDEISINRLRQVITKFSTSLEACIAYGNMSREIIERQRAELEAKENADRLSIMMEELPDGLFVLNHQREIVLKNALGTEYLTVLNHKVIDGALMSIGEYSLEDLENSVAGLPTEIVLEEPQFRVFELASHRVTEADSEVEWLVKIRDVTRERTAQERTQQQERLASVGQLAAGIGHDLNNILTPVMGFAQLIQLRDDIPQKVKEELEKISLQGERAATLVRQILDFSRRSVVQRQTLDLVPFVKESMKLLERTIPETIRMVTEIERGEYVVDASPTQLQQVLTNLAVNARDAMPQGGEFRVGLSLLNVDKSDELPVADLGEGRWVVWSFSDTGSGMSAETLEHIFEPFFTTKALGKGTGLGMAQVHGIVKQSGGEIVVDSELGKGSEFRIYLPCLEKLENTDIEEEVVLPLGNFEKILIVEDEDAVGDVIFAMVKQLNYEPLLAGNGQEALALYETHQKDIALVLTDVVMPDMGGVQLAEILYQKNAHLPIIFMSGYAADEKSDGQIVIPETIAGFISKPAPLDLLAQTLAGALGKS